MVVLQLDATVSASMVGICFAVMGVGEAISSPLLGWYSDRTKGVLKGLVFSFAVSLAGNSMYLFAKLMPFPLLRLAVALASRFLVGAGTANRAICFSFASAVSTTTDRKKVISTVNGGMAIGIAMGPGMQVLINYLVTRKYDFLGLEIDVNNVNAIMGMLTNLLCMFVVISALDEKEKPVKKAPKTSDPEKGEAESVLTFDKLAITVCIISRVQRLFINANFKSIGLLYSEIMFDYSEIDALKVNSNMSLLTSFLVVGVFFLCAFTNITKRISDRILTVVALALTVAYHVVTMPWPFFSGSLPSCEKLDPVTESQYLSWCTTIHPISEYLYFGGYIFLNGIMLPLYGNSTKIILTKLLGPGKQGKSQGLTQSACSISKVGGPIILSFLFANYGPQPNWLLQMLFALVLLILWVVYYKRMSPKF
uniref:MFS domain-containing protein n=1 Tax=Steinernema glaseri TaxID=37863 RepID=A0A1I7Z5F8_9BILA